MTSRNSLAEPAIIIALFMLGLAMRVIAIDRSAVEHFDEGIYASALWFDSTFGQPYPGRHFYAPPLLGKEMALFDIFPGLHWVAPFLPSILAGAATTLVIWVLARAWFGRSAGLFAATIVSLSDFHIAYSRMAMTDVSALALILGAVYVALAGIEKRCWIRMAIAGLITGLAWWTKYTGWLPLAIVVSGSWLWWIWQGRRVVAWYHLMMLQVVMVLSSMLTFAPWWWHLQAFCGYSVVSANHAGYIQNFSSWQTNLASQLTSQFWLDGLPGCASVGLGLLIAGCHRWISARRSTWNTPAAFPPSKLLARFVIAAIALSAIALTVWTPLLLTCIAIGGMAGVFLWPVLPRMYGRAKANDLKPTSPGNVPLCIADLECAPSVDPTLAACTVLTWFCGMLLTTPLYHPYPRLFLPLLASIWIGASGGVSWWIESNLSVARRPSNLPINSGIANRLMSRVIAVMLTVAVVASIIRNENVVRSPIWQDRTSIRRTAFMIADLCYRDAANKTLPARKQLPSGTIIRPNAADTDSNANATKSDEASAAFSSNPNELRSDQQAPQPGGQDQDSADPNESAERDESAKRDEVSLAEISEQEMVVYAFGEPSLLYHLNDIGLIVSPVAHLDLKPSVSKGEEIPTFLVIGPYAKRTEGFWDQWLADQHKFRQVSEVPFYPSEIVLLNLFDAPWLRDHPEAAEQTFEVYRVLSGPGPNTISDGD